MKKHHYIRSMLIVIALIFSSVLPFSASAATLVGNDLMKITKTVDVTSLVEDDIANISLSVKGTPKDSTYVRPNDVILIVDKSGSMREDNRLTAAKDATKEFIDLMDLMQHRVGIVDFSTLVSSYPLTNDATAAKNYVDTIQLGGGTETGAAVRTATAMLANHRPEAQPTIVILTDGEANNTSDALASAKAAQDAGIIFYSIALLGPNEDPNTSAPNQLLKDMSTTADHHHFVLGSVGLSDVYKKIVEEIGLASAYNVKITDTVAPEFEIVPGSYDNNIPKPKVNGNTLEWDIHELKSKELTFTYQVRAKTTTTAGKYSLGTTSAGFEDHQKNNYTANSTNPFINVLNPKPVITSINPEKGLTTGGEEVTITGEKFLPGAKVYFGAKEATVLSESPNTIVVKTPVGVQGTVEVKVTNPDKQFAIGSFMYYADPTISYVTPAEGKMEGGNQVLVVGSNFLNGAKVFINGVEATTTFTSSMKLYAIVPESKTDGLVSVKVVNLDGTEVEKADAYTYLAPPPAPTIELESITPASGELAGGENIYINGKNFDSNAKVYFGDKEAVVKSYINSSKILVTAPQSDTAGFVTVKVVNSDNKFAELSGAYEYLAPPPAPVIELDNITPASGKLAGGESIYINGKNFDKNVTVYFGDKEAVVNSYVNSSKIRVTAPPSDTEGFITVKVVNLDNSFAELVDAYEYLAPPKAPAPEITSLSDATALTGMQKTIYLYGKNFTRASKVFFGDVEAAMVYVSSTNLRITVPASNDAKVVDVKLVNLDEQSAVLVGGFTYEAPVVDPAPTIISLSSNSGTIAGFTPITITGTNFKKGAKVYLGDKLATIVSVTDTEIQVKTPVSTVSGLVSVKVVNPDQQEVILNDGYNYEPLPIIVKGLSVTSGPAKGGNQIYIYGTNFNRNVNVTVDGQKVNYVYVSSTSLRLVMPAAAAPGTVDITVENAGAQASIQYTYN